MDNAGEYLRSSGWEHYQQKLLLYHHWRVHKKTRCLSKDCKSLRALNAAKLIQSYVYFLKFRKCNERRWVFYYQSLWLKGKLQQWHRQLQGGDQFASSCTTLGNAYSSLSLVIRQEELLSQVRQNTLDWREGCSWYGQTLNTFNLCSVSKARWYL